MGGSLRDAIDLPLLRPRTGPHEHRRAPVATECTARRRGGRCGHCAGPDHRLRYPPGHRRARLAAHATGIRIDSRFAGATRLPHRLDRRRRRRQRCRRNRERRASGRLRARAARRPRRGLGAVGHGRTLGLSHRLADSHSEPHRFIRGAGDNADRGRDAGIGGGLPGLRGRRRAPVRLPGRGLAAGGEVAQSRLGRYPRTDNPRRCAHAGNGAAGLRRGALCVPGGGGARSRRPARPCDRGRRLRQRPRLGLACARGAGHPPVRLRASGAGGGRRLFNGILQYFRPAVEPYRPVFTPPGR